MGEGFAERLAAALRGAGPRLLTAELDPPRGPDATRLVERARRLGSFVDALNLTDGSLAVVRLSGMVAAHLVQREAGVEAILHVSCRDRNVIALQADLLGAWALGLRNVLLISGDPPGQGDHPEAKAVFDVPDATALLQLASALAQGRTGSGRPLEGATGFLAGTGANPAAEDLDREMDKLAARVEAGAGFCQTQPVFDVDRAQRFEERRRERFPDLPVLYGLFPLRGLEQGRRLAAVPGMHVPPAVLAELEAAGPDGEADVGLRRACDLAVRLRPLGAGLHVFPLGRPAVVEAVARAVGRG